ncbi:MAG: cupredoxin domain-containing protein [Cryomorphaceae bacterium]|nr:cupredoxin domain-containing protein [Cryomorphaceae bacterium]
MKKVIVLAGMFLAAACGGNEASKDESQPKAPSAKETTPKATEDTQSEFTEGEIIELQLRTTGETMADMEFEPKQLKVPAGSTVKIILDNVAESGAMVHNFVLIERGKSEEIYPLAQEAGAENNFVPDHPSVLAYTPMAQPGETVKVEFEAPASGIYQFICTYPGHASMKGIFIVE